MLFETSTEPRLKITNVLYLKYIKNCDNDPKENYFSTSGYFIKTLHKASVFTIKLDMLINCPYDVTL